MAARKSLVQIPDRRMRECRRATSSTQRRRTAPRERMRRLRGVARRPEAAPREADPLRGAPPVRPPVVPRRTRERTSRKRCPAVPPPRRRAPARPGSRCWRFAWRPWPALVGVADENSETRPFYSSPENCDSAAILARASAGASPGKGASERARRSSHRRSRGRVSVRRSTAACVAHAGVLSDADRESREEEGRSRRGRRAVRVHGRALPAHPSKRGERGRRPEGRGGARRERVPEDHVRRAIRHARERGGELPRFQSPHRARRLEATVRQERPRRPQSAPLEAERRGMLVRQRQLEGRRRPVEADDPEAPRRGGHPLRELPRGDRVRPGAEPHVEQDERLRPPFREARLEPRGCDVERLRLDERADDRVHQLPRLAVAHRAGPAPRRDDLAAGVVRCHEATSLPNRRSLCS